MKQSLSKEFKIIDLGEISNYLGIQIIRNRKGRSIHINQTTYINKVLKKFGMENCIAVAIPMDLKVKLEIRKEEEPLVDKYLY